MGGTLATWLAADADPDVAGLAVRQPVIDPPAESFRELLRAFLAAGHDCVPGPGQRRGRARRPRGGLRRSGRSSPCCRCSRPRTTCCRRLAAVTCPVLIVTSRQDHVVPPVSSDLLAAAVVGPGRAAVPRAQLPPGHPRRGARRGRGGASSTSPAGLRYRLTVGGRSYDGPVDALSRDDVVHVAVLARLDLTDDEIDLFTGQLAAVLDHAADVAALDTAGVPPTAHPLPLVNVLRDDVVRPSLDRDEVLAAAPAVEAGRFQVPPHPRRGAVSRLTAVEIAADVRAGRRTARDVVEEHLAAIAGREPELHAFNLVLADEARAAADEVDRRVAAGDDPGPLAGVPVALKDNLCTRGIPTTCSSRILEGWRPPYDATVVDPAAGRRARSSSARPTSTSSPWARPPRTRPSGPPATPTTRRRVPGGSSGGSAAAVAAGFAALALGSDTGGSIRQPAALCGVVGMKPTYGLVSRYGLVAFASSLDQIGPFAATVADAAAPARGHRRPRPARLHVDRRRPRPG